MVVNKNGKSFFFLRFCDSRMRGRFKNVDVWKAALRAAGVRTPSRFKAIFREKDEKWEEFRRDFDRLQVGLVNGQLIRSTNMPAAKSSFNVFIMQVLGTGKMGRDYPVHLAKPSTNKPLLKVIREKKAPKEYYDFVEKYATSENNEEDENIEAESIDDCNEIVYYRTERKTREKRTKRKRATEEESFEKEYPIKFTKTQENHSDYVLKELNGNGGCFYFHENTDSVTFGTFSKCDIIFPGSDRLMAGESFSEKVGLIHARIMKDIFGTFRIERVRNSTLHINGEELQDRSKLLHSGDVIKIHLNEFEFL